MSNEFEKELGELINRYSIESKSNTPDYLLAKYLIGCLNLYASTVNARDDWLGESDTLTAKSPLIISTENFKIKDDELFYKRLENPIGRITKEGNLAPYDDSMTRIGANGYREIANLLDRYESAKKPE